ncbi:hypothetical protein F4604DRAFT_428140 [Suillus subluteus]|nr:hypothetical protein F4604DRAFT_428140 [Suillus subluteus]
MHYSLVFVFFLAFGFCAAQNYTLPQCAQVCAGTAATAAGCYSSNATCVCGSQPFQSAIQSCFDTSCNTTTQGTAWQYYSILCDAASASSAFPGQSKTTTVSATTGTAPISITSHTSSTQTSSVGSANVSSTSTTSASRSSTSTSGALATEIKVLHCFTAVVVGGALILW